MFAAVNQTVLPEFPRGVNVRWEAVRRSVWNGQKQTREEQELVYEISWIEEIGVWRRFLRSQRSVSA